MENELEEIITPETDYEEITIEQMPEQLLYGPAPTQSEPVSPEPPTTMVPEQLLYGPAPTQTEVPTPEEIIPTDQTGSIFENPEVTGTGSIFENEINK